MMADGTASITSGTVMTQGVSRRCDLISSSMRSSPWKTRKNKRKEYNAVTNTPSSTLRYAIQYTAPCPCQCESRTASINKSLEKNPLLPGKPINASVPTNAVQ